MQKGKLMMRAKGVDNDPFASQIVLDLTFTATGMLNAGSWQPTITYPRGFVTTLGSDGKYGFDCNNYRYMQIPYNSLIAPSRAQLTWEFWYIQRSVTYGNFFSQDKYGVNFDVGFLLNNNKLRIMGDGLRWINDFDTGTKIQNALNSPSYAAYVKDGNIRRGYLNGDRYTDNTAHGVPDNSNPATIGCSGWNNPNAFLDAIISRVRVTTAARFA